MSRAVGVAERDVSGRQKGNAVWPLRVRVRMGAAGERGPAAPRHPPAWVRVVGSEAAAAAPALCLANYCIVAESVRVLIRLSSCSRRGLPDVFRDAVQNLPLAV